MQNPYGYIAPLDESVTFLWGSKILQLCNVNKLKRAAIK